MCGSVYIMNAMTMMKRLMNICLLLSAMVAIAQTGYVPDRGDYTFRTEVLQSCDEDDDQWCHADSILVYITDAQGGTQVRTVWAQPLDTAMWNGFGSILEEDINFDGYPDLQVCNGPVNAFGNFTYTAFLWNQASHGFVEVEGYDEIFAPEVYPAEKRIVGMWRLDDDVEISTYEWRDGKLELVASEQLKYNELAE